MVVHRFLPLQQTTSSLLLLGISLGGAHVIVVTLSETFGRWLPPLVLMLLEALAVTTSLTAIGVLGWGVIRESQQHEAPDPRRVRNWLRWSSIGTVGMLLLLPSIVEHDVQHVVYLALEGGAILALVGWISHGLLSVFYHYRTARTPFLLRGVSFVFAVTLLLEWIEHLTDVESLKAAKAINVLVLVVLTLLLSRRRRWLRLTTRAERWSLAGWAAVLAGVAAFAAITLFDGQTHQAQALREWFVGSNILAGSLFLMVSTYAVVVVATVVGGEGAAERKAFEFDAITFLSRVASQHDTPEELYQTIITLALGLSDATSAWLYLNDDTGEPRIAVLAGIDVDRAEALMIPELIGRTLERDVVVIPWLREDERFYRIARSVESYAQSLVVVPLADNDTYYGSIVLLSNQPFAFERGDIQLLDAFAPAVTIALANNRLMREALLRERLQRELSMAREIQQKLLPDDIPPLNGWEVVGWSEPAYEVGGDYFDYFWLSGGTACVLVADVSGKGIRAALYMAKLKGVCTALAPMCSDVHEFVVRIHQTFEGVLERRVYITLAAIGIAPDGSTTIVRAGHPPPFASQSKGKVEILSTRGIALGLVSTERFSEITEVTELDHRWQQLVLYTDGVIEAGVTSNKELGLNGFSDLVFQASHLASAAAIAENLRTVLRQRAGEHILHDDMTMVVLRCSTNTEVTSESGLPC